MRPSRRPLLSRRFRLLRCPRLRVRGWAKGPPLVLAAFLLAAGVVPAACKPAAAKPARIVSLNLCADQLVILLADRDRIASVSYVARDPHDSAVAADAAGLPVNHGLAEEILPLAPDLVLASAFTARPTVFLLRRLGYPVVELPHPSSLGDVRANVRAVALAVGEEARGEAVLAAFDRKLTALPPQSAPRPLAALYWANGYTSGRGTLANASVEAAGFRTLGNAMGLMETAQLPLEVLLAADVDVLVVGRRRGTPALAEEVFRHPALTRAFAGRPVLEVPDNLWDCGTPFVADAITLLATVRERVADAKAGLR